jgi:hypothetical protein
MVKVERIAEPRRRVFPWRKMPRPQELVKGIERIYTLYNVQFGSIG